MSDISFYLQIALLLIRHAKPSVIEHVKPILLDIRNYINDAFPGE